MLQRTQLGHHSHQARILALDPYLLPHLGLLASVGEHLIGLIVVRKFSGETETLAKGEAGKGIRGKGGGGAGVNGLEGPKVEEERGLGDGEVEGKGGG